MKAMPIVILSDIEHNDDLVVGRKWNVFSEELVINNGLARLFNRSGAEHTENVPSITGKRLGVPDMRLIAEGIGSQDGLGSAKSILGSGPSRAIAYQKEHGNLQLIAHNIVEYRGESLTHIPFGERLSTLWEAVNALREHGLENVGVELLFTYNKLEAFQKVVSIGGEGVVVKKLSGLEHDWFKVKKAKTWDAVIMGFTEGKGKYSEVIGAIRYGFYDDSGNLRETGECSGMTDAQRAMFAFEPEAYIGRVVEIKGQELGSQGGIVFPRYVDMRDDKLPTECLLPSS